MKLIVLICMLTTASLFGEDIENMSKAEIRFFNGDFETIEIKKSYNELGSFLKEKESDIDKYGTIYQYDKDNKKIVLITKNDVAVMEKETYDGDSYYELYYQVIELPKYENTRVFLRKVVTLFYDDAQFGENTRVLYQLIILKKKKTDILLIKEFDENLAHWDTYYTKVDFKIDENYNIEIDTYSDQEGHITHTIEKYEIDDKKCAFKLISEENMK